MSRLFLQKTIQRQINSLFLLQFIIDDQNRLSSRKMLFVYMHVFFIQFFRDLFCPKKPADHPKTLEGFFCFCRDIIPVFLRKISLRYFHCPADKIAPGAVYPHQFSKEDRTFHLSQIRHCIIFQVNPFFFPRFPDLPDISWKIPFFLFFITHSLSTPLCHPC